MKNTNFFKMLKPMNQIAFFGLLCAYLLAGCSHPGYDQTKSGALYKIHTAGNSKKIKIGDVIKMNFSVATEKDSIIQSSWKMGSPLLVSVQKSRSMADLMDMFVLLHEKDSATIKLPSDSLFDPKKGAMRPPFFKPHSYVVFNIKVEKVMNQQEAQLDKANEEKKMEAKEVALFAKYIADHHLHTDSTKSGVQFTTETIGTGSIPKLGDSVFVYYTGKLLDGKVFDTNDSTVAKANKLYSLGRKMQGGYKALPVVLGAHMVVSGWEDYLSIAKKGSKATLYLPSKLAYGPRSIGPIPPFSTLIFNVELVNVKAPKPAPKQGAMKNSMSISQASGQPRTLSAESKTNSSKTSAESKAKSSTPHKNGSAKE